MRYLTTAVALLSGVTLMIGGPAGASEFYAQGMARAAAKDWPAALDLLEKAVATEPDDLRFGAEYRQAVIAAGEYERCLAFFEQLVADHPEAANAHLNLGFAHVDKIPVEGAITQVILANSALTHFSAALELRDTWIGRYTRGNSYLYWPAIFGRTQLGIDDLEHAILMANKLAKKSYHGRAWASLGDGYWRLSDPGKARETYLRGLESYPDNQELKARAGLEGEALDAYLEAVFDTSRRVATDLREIWEADGDE